MNTEKKLSEKLWVFTNGPTAAELGELICTNGQLRLALMLVERISDTGKYLVSAGEPVEVALRDMMLDYEGYEELFLVWIRGACQRAIIDDIAYNSVGILYDPTMRIGLIQSMHLHEKDMPNTNTVRFQWPEPYETTDQEERQRQQFVESMKALAEI